MVHSFYSNSSKTEGDKSANKSTSEQQANPANHSTAPIVRCNSNGSECLFSRSADELLELELDYELRSTKPVVQQARDTSTFDDHLYDHQSNNNNNNNNNINSSSGESINRTSFENGFSIDSREEKSYSQYNNQNCCYNLFCLSKRSDFSRWPTRVSAEFKKLTKMPPRRYYSILIFLTLIILSCLVATLVISRGVGLEAELDATSANSPQSFSLSASSRLTRPIELEQRAIDLIDLIECGKTFAYVKYRISAKVPKTSPVYNQQPSFLLNDKELLAKLSAERQNNEQEVGAESSRYYLTSVKELEAASNEAAETIVASDAGTSAPAAAGSTDSPLNSEIKPVEPAKSPRAIEELASILATATSGASEQELANWGPSGPSLDQMDPLELAASRMHINLESISNKTIVDCFIVDTEKRYNQKIQMEDLYRSTANTRRVDFKRIMQVIVDCRRLTWNSFPDKLKIKTIPGEAPIVLSAISSQISQEPKSSSEQPAREFLSSLFGGWLNGAVQRQDSPSTIRQAPVDNLEPESIASAQIKPFKAAKKVDTIETLPIRDVKQVQKEQQQEKKQASFLGMGISMANGIIPNTLWCGLGDRASNYSELGSEYKVDACCRAHDHCPIRLKPFTSDYGLINWSVSTRSHCDCDLDFNDCLNGINSTLSDVIKVLYFRFVGLQCIDVEGRQKVTLTD